MSSRSKTSDSGRNYLPSELLQHSDNVIEFARKLLTHEQNKVLHGAMTAAPTTPSSQAAGDLGILDWNIDIDGGEVVVNSLPIEVAEAVDFDVSTGVAVLVAGQSVIAAIIVVDTGLVMPVLGTPAATGAQRAPTDPVITAAVVAAVGAGHEWIKLAECTLNRAADAMGVGVVTQSQDNGARPIFGVNVDGVLGL